MVTANTINPKVRVSKAEGWSEWIRSEHDERAVANGCHFSISHAEHVRSFFEKWLRHSKGIWGGRPFTLLDWQWDGLIAPMFGWLRGDGYRRIRRCYCEIPKKNGKSTLGSGVGLYLVVADGEPGSEVYSAATKRDQAAIVHNEAINMVRASPMLLKRLRINESTKTITCHATMSKYLALASDGPGSEGFNIHGLIVDELHAWKDRSFWDTLRYGFAARKQPLTLVITTAGVHNKTSLGWQEHEYARRWLEGEIKDEEYHAFVRCAGKDDDPFAATTHAKANPSLPEIIDPLEIMKAAVDAQNKPAELFAFMRYRLSVWTESSSSWLDMVKWDACDEEVEESALAGRKCFAGLDLASRRDLTAWVLLFPPTDDDPKWRILARFWVPRDGAAVRAKNDGVKYLVWHRQGWITLTDGNDTDDSGVIRAQIERDIATFDIQREGVGADKWNLSAIRQAVDPDGEYIVEFGQNFHDMSPPMKKLEAMVMDEKVAHGGNPVLRWNVANVKVIDDTNANIRPSKKHSTEKIDGAVALIMALGRAEAQTEEECVYSTRGIDFV